MKHPRVRELEELEEELDELLEAGLIDYDYYVEVNEIIATIKVEYETW